MFVRRVRALGLACVALVSAALLPAITAPAASAAGATLPAGFVLRDQPSGQAANDLTDFAYLPDGSMLTTGKQGKVDWVGLDGQAHVLTTLGVNSGGDLGLIGLAIAPDYATSHKIYLARSTPVVNGAFTLRVASWTVTGATDPTGLSAEQVILEVPGISTVHGITGLVAPKDGTLWISFGDNGDFTKVDPTAVRALDINQPQGKILHVTAAGQGVPSNPYYDPANPGATKSKVYASGFRSPFRFTLDPATGTPTVGDVGWNDWEEVDVVQAGGNYGWPCFEGNNPTPGYAGVAGCASTVNTPPIWQYHHGAAPDQGNAVVGGIVYNGTSYPAAYQGSYFFGDYVGQKLWTMRYNAQGVLTQAPESPPVFSGLGGPVKIAAAANGDIVFADIYSGNIRRLSYVNGNSAPVAQATSTTDPATRTVSFDGTGSYDFDKDPLTYKWDFGDGTTGTGATVSHTYATGTDKLTATLTVTDPLGATGTTNIVVAPGNHSPVLTLTTPGAHTFAVNEPVDISATATDAEDGTLPISWTTLIRHCPSEQTCHSHPDASGTGTTFDAPFTDHPDSRMEFTATVTDSAGVTTTATYVALPRQHRLTLVSNLPAGLQIPAEGDVSTALVTEGATFDVDAAPLATDGASKFTNWVNGPNTPSWTITVGATDQTLTANYITAIDQRYAAEPALQTLLGPATGTEVLDGSVRYKTYQNGRLYWSSATGVHEIQGRILAAYLRLGGHTKFGPPTNDEDGTPDGIGRFNHFAGTPGTLVASIYYTPSTDAHAIYGLIRQKWAASGWEAGPAGYPTNDEDGTPDGIGRFNHFSKAASIYYSPSTGAQLIYGLIRQRWSALGWEKSYLGYPTTSEFSIPIGRQNSFQNGIITYNTSTGAVVDKRN